MTATEQTSSAPSGNWLANQPYLLLSITALCGAGNAIVGRLAAGHIAPATLSFLRWSFAFWVGQVAVIAVLLSYMLRS